MLPESWVNRIFDQMAAMYGSKFAELWRGTDITKVKAMWAEKLAGFADKPKAIKAALDALDERPFPPTLPEFIHLCRDAARRFGDAKPAMLPHKPTPDEIEHTRELAEKAAQAVKVEKISNGIDVHWATHPRSAMHLRFIFDAAKKDARFRPCVAKMVEGGICTEDGKLLKSYANGQWQRAA